jgi:nucleobase:cation symporter-1, NCS1 family
VVRAGPGPFPSDGFIPLLKGLYDYSWVVGFAAGFLICLMLALLVPAKSAARTVAVTAARE